MSSYNKYRQGRHGFDMPGKSLEERARDEGVSVETLKAQIKQDREEKEATKSEWDLWRLQCGGWNNKSQKKG